MSIHFKMALWLRKQPLQNVIFKLFKSKLCVFVCVRVEWERVWERVCVRETVSVRVWKREIVCERECVCERVWERESASECMCVCYALKQSTFFQFMHVFVFFPMQWRIPAWNTNDDGMADRKTRTESTKV